MNHDLAEYFSKYPYRLFLTDGLGAGLSLFLYLSLLIPFRHIFGMPKDKIYFLAILAGVYLVFSLSCYLFQVEKWQSYLKGIAGANFLHTLITLVLIIVFWKELTSIGLFYFSAEIIIVLWLARLEWNTAHSQ